MTPTLSRTTRIVAMMLTLAPAAPAAAQRAPDPLSDKSLEELMAVQVDSVVGAARHEQRLAEAPSSVTIVTARDIRAFGWRTFAELLQAVRGMYVTYDRNYTYLGVRGFGRPTDYNNRVLVLIDGHRLNDAIYDGAMIGTEFPLDLELIERVEVIRGPGSALYGTSAFFAVINVITRRGPALGGEAAFEAGWFNTYRGRATFGWGDGGERDLLVSITRRTSEGPGVLYFPEFDSPSTNGGLVFHQDGDRSTNALLTAAVGRWRFQGLFGSREKDVPTASWFTAFNDGRLQTTDTRGWVTAEYERQAGAATVTARGFYDRYVYTGTYPFDVDGGSLIGDDSAHMDTVGGEATVRRRLGRRHLITAGMEQRSHLRQNQFYAEGDSVLDDRRSSVEVAAYVQDEVVLAQRWTAVLGGRYDWWSHKGGTGRPRLGLIYRTDYDTAVKLLYGEAYRAPTVYELYYYAAPDGLPNAGVRLAPELLRTTEVVFEQFVKGRVRLAATAYYTSIRDLIDPTMSDDGDLVHRNQESARTGGFELEAESRSASGVLVRASYAFQEAHDRADARTLSNAPHQLATFQISVPAWRHQLRFSSDTSAVGWRETITGDRLAAYAVANATVTYEPLRRPLTLGASAYNLFDAAYSHPVGPEFVQHSIQQDGRTVALRFSVRF